MAGSIPLLCENLRHLRMVLMLVLLGMTCPLTATEPGQAAKDLAVVKKFLAGHYPDKSWQQGPAAMQNAALAKAFPDARFYYVFSPPPPRAELISVMMRVQDDGKLSEVSGADSMNQGLMKVASTADAKVAGAAIMSLTFGPSGPVSISSADVPVARLDGGWYCLATPGPPGGKREALAVTFDAAGRCISVVRRRGGP